MKCVPVSQPVVPHNKSTTVDSIGAFITKLVCDVINRNVVMTICATLPFFFVGVHRQVLMTTLGWFVGYHMTKHANYVYAKHDREMYEYIRLHPEDFPPKEKKTFAEIVEPFHPVR
uniref:NADH:ubiquinone oxidoreductase subunit C2 n=1 Tax=Scophthalmus maximus TaxID=52904 RepID=A0A8D3D0B2_SCOMX